MAKPRLCLRQLRRSIAAWPGSRSICTVTSLRLHAAKRSGAKKIVRAPEYVLYADRMLRPMPSLRPLAMVSHSGQSVHTSMLHVGFNIYIRYIFVLLLVLFSSNTPSFLTLTQLPQVRRRQRARLPASPACCASYTPSCATTNQRFGILCYSTPLRQRWD